MNWLRQFNITGCCPKCRSRAPGALGAGTSAACASPALAGLGNTTLCLAPPRRLQHHSSCAQARRSIACAPAARGPRIQCPPTPRHTRGSGSPSFAAAACAALPSASRGTPAREPYARLRRARERSQQQLRKEGTGVFHHDQDHVFWSTRFPLLAAGCPRVRRSRAKGNGEGRARARPGVGGHCFRDAGAAGALAM